MGLGVRLGCSPLPSPRFAQLGGEIEQRDAPHLELRDERSPRTNLCKPAAAVSFFKAP
jgi:hypothetical protein